MASSQRWVLLLLLLAAAALLLVSSPREWHWVIFIICPTCVSACAGVHLNQPFMQLSLY
jgi:hypothetical protein